jgi:hypothetical protein
MTAMSSVASHVPALQQFDIGHVQIMFPNDDVIEEAPPAQPHRERGLNKGRHVGGLSEAVFSVADRCLNDIDVLVGDQAVRRAHRLITGC